MSMFSFIKVRRARAIVEGISPVLVNGLKDLPPIDRAGTLAIANAMLLSATAFWGKPLGEPFSLPRELAAEVVFSLAESHARVLHEVMLPLQKRNMDDVIYAQGMRELRATELLIVTFGPALVPSARASAIAGWRLLYLARENASAAAAVLAQFASHSKTRPFPQVPGRKIGRNEVITLAKSVPTFLRKPAGPRKRAAVAGAKS